MRQSIQHFLGHQAASGIVLMVSAAIALIWANSPAAAFHVIIFNPTVRLLINDGAMAVFFLLVGLEIKREIVMGELSTRAKALQPIFAALGGMFVPALIFIMLTHSHSDFVRGWAIPTATDIAFALGVLALLGSRIPQQIKVLLTAIAIIDDLGAILVIAIFYSEKIKLIFFSFALLGIMALIFLNHKNFRSIFPYAVCGAVIWLSFFKAGIHPTLAGVVMAFAIPIKVDRKGVLTSPLLRLEHALHPYIAFLVMPVFALANAALSFKGMSLQTLAQPLSFAIIAGLVLGKPLGIMSGLIVGHYSGLACKVKDKAWRDYLGLGFLCGIGFTMALFIGDLAFDRPELVDDVKLGVLSASLLSAAIGWGICRLTFIHKTR